jgi:thioredoxin reductase
MAEERESMEYDLVIVGAGPAGLAAAAEAQALGLRALTLEQASVADSLRSFPRGKLIVEGDAEVTKEELVARSLRAVREKRMSIEEGVRVTALERLPSGFAVHTAGGATHRAAHVLLAVGRRGSPRRLAVDTAAFADHVHYALADARSFAGRRCLVVGLGDVAMETAIALSRQPGTEVTVSYRGDDFRRGRARNIAEVRRRAAAGALRLLWRSEVTSVARGVVTLATPDGAVEVGCDSLFVLIGSDVPVHRPFPIPIR